MSRIVPKRAESVRKKVNNVRILAIYLFISHLYCKLPLYVCILHEVQTTVDKISSRIIILHINGNPLLRVICCYNPTNCSDDDVKADFYRSLSKSPEPFLQFHDIICLQFVVISMLRLGSNTRFS